MSHPPAPGAVDGQLAVVTGAGRGIGQAIARALADKGARVVVNDLDASAVHQVAEQIGGYAVPGDAASVEGVARLIRTVRERHGDIDLYVANAGVETGSALTEQAWDVSWQVNVMAHVRAFRELRDPWLARGRGRFVAVVSAAGLLTMLGSPAYSATKHAALAHAEWLSATYGDQGIVVHAVCPQGVATELLPDTVASEVVLSKTVIQPEAVAVAVVDALAGSQFLVLPHPEVAGYYRARATDTDRWLAGMRRIQRRIREGEEAGSGGPRTVEGPHAQ